MSLRRAWDFGSTPDHALRKASEPATQIEKAIDLRDEPDRNTCPVVFLYHAPMHTFFHGWRRKAGCVALVMALCLLALWFRSHVVADTLAVCIGEAIEAETSQGMFEVLHNNIGYVDDLGVRHTSVPGGLSWRSESTDVLPTGGPSMFGGTKSYFRCSLLWFVLPLTILSAYLLLVPSRKRPSTESQPHA
ncbi:MAG: hypothetical protein JWP89_1407 [Schlesneria sp.]|nr:hypothetical protein [Schlesneria sp.]